MSVHVADGAARLSDKLPIVVRPWVVPVLSVAFLLSAGLGMVVTGPRLPAAPVPLVRDEAEVPGIGEGSGASINGPERDPAAAAGPERRMPDIATPAAQILQPADGSHLAMDQPLDMAAAPPEPKRRVSQKGASPGG